MEATLNVRMDAPLKKRGDKVLQDHGISTSAAVRALWHELATTRKLPEFLRQAQQRDAQVAARIDALNELAGIGKGKLTNATDDELHAIGMKRYE